MSSSTAFDFGQGNNNTASKTPRKRAKLPYRFRDIVSKRLQEDLENLIDLPSARDRPHLAVGTGEVVWRWT